MEIQGFYYDKHRKKYFRIGSGNSGQNQITKEHLKQKTAIESMESYHRLDGTIHLPQTLHKQEINFQTKYNLKEEVIRSQIKAMKILKTLDLEMIDFCGNEMKDISVDSMIGSATSDKLFAVLTGDTGAVIYEISVEDIFNEDFDVNQSKRVINAFPKPNRVIDISYINGSNEWLTTIVHHFPNRNTINTSFTLTPINGLFQTRDLRQVYEFSEPIFSSTHFENMNILGAEKKVYVFKPSHSGKIRIIRFDDKITALKTSSDGKLFIGGSNKGQLHCFDVRDNDNLSKRSGLSLNNGSVVFLDILKDNHSVISSCHNHYIALSDLRMFDKPVLQYLNHSNHCSKLPFSVDESLNVLCSSGDDNIVRFWSINSAKLVHMFSPRLKDNQNNNSLSSLQPLSHVWYSNSWKCLRNQFKPLLFSMSANRLDVITHPNLSFD